MAVSVKSAQRRPLSYKGYLKLDELLSLQKPLSKPAQHDELLFVIAHQVYELWFKLMVDELETAITLMSSGDLYEAARLIRRVVTIQKVLIQQLEVLETIRPTDFLKFRSVLSPESGYSAVVDLAEALLEYDKYFWLWRNHHMGMVERIIGRKHGTGAEVVKETMNSYSFQSSGVSYLKTTLKRRFFPALWAARTKISEV